MLERYIKDNQIYIDSENWSMLNKKYDKDDLKRELADLILAGYIDFPLLNISKKDVKDEFRKMEDYNKQSAFKIDKNEELLTRYDYSYKLGRKYFDVPNTGNRASNYFQQESRMKCGSTTCASPEEIWTTENGLMSMLGCIWSMKMKKVDDTSFRKALALRKYVASQFKPLMAKVIYEYYEAENILDFCSGWGDRLAGFYASEKTKLYVGTDPNAATFSSYLEQIKCYEQIGKYAQGKEHELYCSPAEDLNYKRYYNKMDLVFTSPPYFNKERYSTRNNQSYLRYNSIDDWLYKFLCRTLEYAWRTLKKGGIMAINISDVYYRNTTIQFCDRMNDFIRDELNGHYLGCTGMKLSRRPNSKILTGREGVFIEPIWTWEKWR